MRFLLLLITSCASVADTLGSCCLATVRSEIRNCIVGQLEEGNCQTWHCPTTSGAVCLFDGKATIPAKDFCELTPDVPDEWCEGGEEHW